MRHDILETIITYKRIEVRRQRAAFPLAELLEQSSIALKRTSVSMRQSLEHSAVGIIAEFKRKSPSKGWLHPAASIEEVVPSYQTGGAAACSILTDAEFFGGSLEDLKKARSQTTLPLLRKDFIVDSYQLYQAKAARADAVLLIAAVLSPDDCRTLSETAHTLGLEVLLEIHQADELICLNPYVDMLGINNRNLGSFRTSVSHSSELLPEIRAFLRKEEKYTPLLVTESGITDPAEVTRLRTAGFRGFLIGETFMRTDNPGQTLRTFIQSCTSHAD